MLPVCVPALAALEAAFVRMWALAGRPLPEDETTAAPEECGPSAVRVVEGFPGQSRIYRAVQLLAAAVTERLWITDAYLVAPPALYAAFVDAARSGVDVRMLLPGTSDIPIVRIFTRGGYRELLHAGARIFEYRGPRSEEHTSELQSHLNLVCRVLLETQKIGGNSVSVIASGWANKVQRGCGVEG